MICGRCETHINARVRQNFLVNQFPSAYREGKTMMISEDEIDKNHLHAAITAMEYEKVEIQKEIRR